MLAKLIIIVIIIVIFILLFLNLKKKEGFQTQTPTTSSAQFNTQCYDTELTNCVGNCDIVEDIERTKCVENNSCSSLSESNCNNGCSFETVLDSNCENKTSQQDCDSSICVWNTSQNKCFEKNANYEKSYEVLNGYSPRCSVDSNEARNHPQVGELYNDIRTDMGENEFRNYMRSWENRSNLELRLTNERRRPIYRQLCENNSGCMYIPPISANQYYDLGQCKLDHPCRRHTTESSCVADRDNECSFRFYENGDNRCDIAQSFDEKVTGYSPQRFYPQTGRINGKQEGADIYNRVPISERECRDNYSNVPNFVADNYNNNCYSDIQLCKYINNESLSADSDDYRNLIANKCFSMRATSNHYDLDAPRGMMGSSSSSYYSHSLLRDPSKMKFFSCEEIEKLYLYSKMLLETQVGSNCNSDSLPDYRIISVGSSALDERTTPEISNLDCYFIPSELSSNGPSDSNPNRGKLAYIEGATNDYWNGIFTVVQSNNRITITRTDTRQDGSVGWNFDLKFICKKKKTLLKI